jgi:hypothetical protein
MKTEQKVPAELAAVFAAFRAADRAEDVHDVLSTAVMRGDAGALPLLQLYGAWLAAESVGTPHPFRRG